jgi:hypothetical protein
MQGQDRAGNKFCQHCSTSSTTRERPGFPGLDKNPSPARLLLSETVHNGTEHVTYVSHDVEDGAWQFPGDSMSDGGGRVLSCLYHPIDRDPSLAELADLPLGWYAERGKVGEPWVRRKHMLEDTTE